MKIKDLKGFTLAEVLITLVIIGVVTALTIPNIIIAYQKRATMTRLKKSYALVSNALNSAQETYGYHRNWDLSSLGETEQERAIGFTEKFLLPYLKVNRFCKGEADCNYGCSWAGSTPINFTLPDGVIVGVTAVNSNGSRIIIGLNGYKKQQNGKDCFPYVVTVKETNPAMMNLLYKTSPVRNLLLKPIKWDWWGNREDILNGDGWGDCAKGRRMETCSTLIMMDNWQIKDDYPW